MTDTTTDPVAAVTGLGDKLRAAQTEVARIKAEIAAVKQAFRASLAPKRKATRARKALGTATPKQPRKKRGLPPKPEAVASEG